MSSRASVAGDARLRLFLALRLPDDVLLGLDSWAATHLPSGRRVRVDDLHVTLAFLGWRPTVELPEIAEALRHAAGASRPFALEVERWRETRSVGMLVLDDPTASGARLADDLHGRLEALGVYRREARPWLPHVTLLRFRERPRLRPPRPELPVFVVSDAAAYISRLHPSGARYEVLESMRLGGPEE